MNDFINTSFNELLNTLETSLPINEQNAIGVNPFGPLGLSPNTNTTLDEETLLELFDTAGLDAFGNPIEYGEGAGPDGSGEEPADTAVNPNA
tara:strand:+ start:301 stop:576 length:276 start_codon:yes stop_codon:yes gene_type:complete